MITTWAATPKIKMESNIILKCFFIIVYFLIKFIELYISYHSCLTNTTIGTAKKAVVPINCFMTTAHFPAVLFLTLIRNGRAFPDD